MDSLDVAPLWDAMSTFGGWPMVDPDWDPTSFSSELGLSSLRDIGFAPALSAGIAADVVNTSRKILYVSDLLKIFAFMKCYQP